MARHKSQHYDLMFQNGKATKEYSVYSGMIQRCKSNKPNYETIDVDEIFLDPINGFKSFLDDVGLCPNVTFDIDRIRNLEGYKPGNLRWTSRSDNLLNISCTLMVELKDKSIVPLKQFCNDKGYSYHRLRQRYRGGKLIRNYIEII